jgi:hypothetical protein
MFVAEGGVEVSQRKARGENPIVRAFDQVIDHAVARHCIRLVELCEVGEVVDSIEVWCSDCEQEAPFMILSPGFFPIVKFLESHGFTFKVERVVA